MLADASMTSDQDVVSFFKNLPGEFLRANQAFPKMQAIHLQMNFSPPV